MSDPISLFKVHHSAAPQTNYEVSAVEEFDYSEIFQKPKFLVDFITFDRALSDTEIIAVQYNFRRKYRMGLWERFIGWINYNHMNYYKDWK